MTTRIRIEFDVDEEYTDPTQPLGISAALDEDIADFVLEHGENHEVEKA